MKYQKKIIILNEVNGGFSRAEVRGSLVLEKTAAKVVATVVFFQLRDLERGEYLLGLTVGDTRCEVFNLGRSGRINRTFELHKDMDLQCKIVGVLAYADGKQAMAVAFGSNEPRKLWQGNMLDGIIRRPEFFDNQEVESQPQEQAVQEHTQDFLRKDWFEEEIDDKTASPQKGAAQEVKAEVIDWAQESPAPTLFFDIIKNADYADNAVMTSNYYPQGYGEKIERKSPFGKKPKPNIDGSCEALSAVAFTRVQKNPPYENQSEASLDEEICELIAQAAQKAAQQNAQYMRSIYKEESTQKGAWATYALLDNEDSEQAKLGSEATHEQHFSYVDSPHDGQAEHTQPIFEAAADASLEFSYLEASKAEQERASSDNTYSYIRPEGKRKTPFGHSVQAQATESHAEAGDKSSLRPDYCSYYERVKAQIDDLFQRFPQASDLQELLPDTKWVKVDYDGSGKFYVIGLIGDAPSYICYGVPAKYTAQQPKELEGYCQWFPLDFKNPQGEGYWLMYQDSKTGESVTVEIV